MNNGLDTISVFTLSDTVRVEGDPMFDYETFFSRHGVRMTPAFGQRVHRRIIADVIVPKTHQLAMHEIGRRIAQQDILKRVPAILPVPLWVPCVLEERQAKDQDGDLVQGERLNVFWCDIVGSALPIVVSFDEHDDTCCFDILDPDTKLEKYDRIFPGI